jgi:lysophospholipase L1-like esterase
MASKLQSIVVGIGRFIRSAWLMIGLTIAVFLCMESAYRLQRAGREKIYGAPSPIPPDDPQIRADWFETFNREYDATRPQRWQSYLYWGRRPNFHGTYVNIDSAGHRVTPQPRTPAEPAARVFFFGGSTMWGTAQRDDHTIAAEAARRLQTLAPGSRVEVTNFGESGYVSSQELIDLILALRSGQRPDVVVFYDGINDVGTTVQFGMPGLPQNENKRIAEFDLGRAIDRASFERGLGKDLRAWKRLTGQAFQQLALVEWAQRVKRRGPPTFAAAEPSGRRAPRPQKHKKKDVVGVAGAKLV